MTKVSSSLILAAIAANALFACGRNPGAHARPYPGTEKIEAALAAAEPKCVSFDAKQIRRAAVVTGKEKFKTDRRGVFRLESYRVSPFTDRTDRTISNAIYQVTEFEDLASPAPRLAVEATCLDLKGQSQSLSVAPVTRIDSSTGVVLQIQPFDLEADATGGLRAASRVPTVVAQALPATKIPEVAILLGSDFQKTFRTVSFRAEESGDGSLSVKAEFVGMDPASLSRLFVRVEAVYGWDAAE